MKTFKTIIKYFLYALAIVVGLPIIAWLIATCLTLGLASPLFGICIIAGIWIIIKTCQSKQIKKLTEENQQLRKRIEELENGR